MSTLLDDPLVQAALAPLLLALLVSGVLQRTRFAWFAVVAAIGTEVALSTGFGFTPLTASRKVLLLVLLAPLIGLALDLWPRPPRATPALLAALGGGAAVWAFWSVLAQSEPLHMLALAVTLALFVGLLVALTLRLRHEGAAGGAATVALGLAVGVTAVLSASIGNFAHGIALAVAGAALLLWQFTSQRALVPGYLGMLSVGLAAALFTGGTFMLAQLPWYAMPALLLVPLAASLNVFAQRPPRLRLTALTLLCVAVASAPMLAAWLAARTPAP